MSQAMNVTVIEDNVHLSLGDLCRACVMREEQVRVWVVEGVLQPIDGASPAEWRFAGTSLRRARLAATLSRDLEVNAPGIAFALDLMDEIDSLRASLRRRGAGA